MLKMASSGAIAWPPRDWSDLSGRSILVTGASSGIGRSTAVALAAHGADVVLLARRRAALESVRDEINDCAQRDAKIIAADVTDIRELAGHIEGLPRLHGAVNNAGHNIPQPLEDITPGHFRYSV
jgi:NAD(P)-dependent dehydrogenase (short-subunit alcohol dehydrogenase family)